MAVIEGSDLEQIDVLSNRVFAEGVPHEALARLRAERPIHFQRIPDERLYDQAWVLTKYEDVLAVSKDTDHFNNEHGLNLRASYSAEEQRHLLNLDDPEHLRLRRMTNKNFTPRVVRRYTDHYHDMVGRLLDGAITRGSGDAAAGTAEIEIVDDVSVPMPLLAICELLGTTPDDREQLIRWSNAIITNDDPDYSPSEEYRTQAGLEMMQYALDMLADRRASPQDDLASVLAEKLDQGELTVEEYAGYVTLLFVAGNETTRNNISHGMLQLAQNPEQYELLKTGDHWDTAVEEMIRWSSPVIYMSRTVVEDIEYKGHHFAKGDKVVLHYASANRDEDVFENPMTFDVTRDPNPHLAFGFGAHFCLGAHLARLETRCVLEQMVKRVDALELVGQESYVWSSFIAGIKKLDVRLQLI